MTRPVLSAPTSIAISVRRSGTTLSAHTTLTYPEAVLVGEMRRDDDNRVRAIAQATLEALRDIAPGTVESAQVLAVPGRKVAVTVVEFPAAHGGYDAFVGSALVRGEVEDALARSVLDAITDWIDIKETS
jgi:hypothetical protein